MQTHNGRSLATAIARDECAGDSAQPHTSSQCCSLQKSKGTVHIWEKSRTSIT